MIVDSRPNRPTPRPDVITRRHRPVVVNNHVRVIRYTRPVDYYRVIPRRHIYRRWVFSPVPRYYYPGYRVIDNYPWYIHNHYRYRYSPVETCQYDLVDSETNTTVRTFGESGNLSCNLAYDLCAADRDAANAGTYEDERYFCAESVSDEYANNDDTVFNPNDDVILSEDQQNRIEDYLAVTTDLQAYRDAVAGRLGECSVWKLRGNRHGCTYRMKVNGENYPDAQGLVCSAPAQADIIGCNVGSEQENIGCILKNAVSNGHCL